MKEETCPAIALAVPSLNQGKFLRSCLDSILAQQGVRFKIALMDGGSTDETRKIIAEYSPRLAYWRSRPDNGQAAAINEGIAALGACDYVGWLNSDDILLPDALRKMAKLLADRPQAGAVYAQGLIIDEDGRKQADYPTQVFNKARFAKNCFICQPATLIRKTAWDAVGGLDVEFHMCMDYDLWWRLLAQGTLEYLAEYTACSRDYATTKTRTAQLANVREAQKLLHRHCGQVPANWILEEVVWQWKEKKEKKHGRPNIMEKLALVVEFALVYAKRRSLGERGYLP
ncbi:MAG TPA: glycosyltransferase family 2 protein [Methylomusa anaerophila]|uniref:Chondroitin synthase n=1 Tax=Methylomusa anaerophila TaxID=1930071 RepID=A0A348AKN3_9FIRM|nr:glycosyltransferase family 2 protein [Methylomusa anaerophila]BBB91631.1 chondroitin synthase [Methylomusa anaerophila]HML89431.1 glycosyltransferase family 2 protein [Methylomusa anaerophila]